MITILNTDNKERATRLFKELQREKHGLVADTMEYYGERYAMNYGVSLHTIRAAAQRIGSDHLFARYLFAHSVRELKLASISILEPSSLTSDKELAFWSQGLTTNELCEEFALKALSKCATFWDVFPKWASSDNDFLQYTALMAASRVEPFDIPFILSTIKSIELRGDMLGYKVRAIIRLLVWLIKDNSPNILEQYLAAVPDTSLASHIREEVAWRIEA
ncbi:MAG: DNA alkylation repair protein [Rikenellaceae bacterium]